MSLINAYSETVQQSIDVDLMDVKNIGNMILGYADYSYSQKFLCKFFNFFNHIIESCVYLNKEKTAWYFEHALLEEVDSDLAFKGVRQPLLWFKPVSIDEKELIKALGSFIRTAVIKETKHDPFYNKNVNNVRVSEAFFNMKINKKMAIGIESFRHNSDARSVNAKEYMGKWNMNTTITCAFNFEKNKYVKYFSEGFTLKEYVSEYLQIRGNPYDRWYTMYNEAIIPSEEHLEKVNQIINDDDVKITSENCILFDFDFGS
jgi:hypothetical protein